MGPWFGRGSARMRHKTTSYTLTCFDSCTLFLTMISNKVTHLFLLFQLGQISITLFKLFHISHFNSISRWIIIRKIIRFKTLSKLYQEHNIITLKSFFLHKNIWRGKFISQLVLLIKIVINNTVNQIMILKSNNTQVSALKQDLSLHLEHIINIIWLCVYRHLKFN